MNESPIDSVLCDEATLTDDLPDAALEVAAGKHWEVGKSLYHCILLRVGHLPGLVEGQSNRVSCGVLRRAAELGNKHMLQSDPKRSKAGGRSRDHPS
jgi:hypothetical protein